MDLSDVLALLSLILALAVVVVRPIRQAFLWIVDAVRIAVGTPRRRYARWFLRRHGVLRNIYLDVEEKLDLSSTYVPLAVLTQATEGRIAASTILSDRRIPNLIILGDPGTGKSTLLKAYGASVLGAMGHSSGRVAKERVARGQVPLLVELRHFAYILGTQDLKEPVLEQYLIRFVLGEPGARIKRPERFLGRLLRQHQAVVLLDGLDEVRDVAYEGVRAAIWSFMRTHATSEEGEHPAVRIVLSCRRQNFLRLAGDWVPGFAPGTYTLARFADSDILTYLRGRALQAPRTAEGFFDAVTDSGMIELHRVPLILTISLGLYVHLTAYEIPRSVATFYDEMIKELLRRHDFRTEEIPKANVFPYDDKQRFLREFALDMSRRPSRFEEFTHQEIDAAVRVQAPRLASVEPQDSRRFIAEIVDQSGLLTRLSDSDVYIFAHRSVQEYLAAAQLARSHAAGKLFLWDRAEVSEWRQVILFFAALDHESVQPFIAGLVDRNLELAGHCLAAAQPVSGELVDDILARIGQRIRDGTEVAESLSALVAVTRSPKASARQAALNSLRDVLSGFETPADIGQLLGLDANGLLELVVVLVATQSPDIVATATRVAALIADDDLRVVGPLWRGLATSRLEEHPDVASPLVDRLLSLVMDENGLRELERQPRFVPGFCTPAARRRVYPFEHGLDLSANLVTLLAWAQHVRLAPSSSNRFLTATATPGDAFQTLEQAYRRRSLAVAPFLPGRIFFGLACASALGAIAGTVATNGWSSLGLRSDHVAWNALYVVSPIMSFLIAGGLAARGLSYPSYFAGMMTREEPILSPAPSNPVVQWLDRRLLWMFEDGTFFWDEDTLLAAAVLLPILTPLGVGFRILVPAMPLVPYVIAASLMLWIVFWLPATVLFTPGRRLYLRSPNPFIDAYDDPRSRHWLVPPAT